SVRPVSGRAGLPWRSPARSPADIPGEPGSSSSPRSQPRSWCSRRSQTRSACATRLRLVGSGLDTAVQWSYDLLSDPERLLFERLSAFAGGFSLDDAETVAGDARLPERGVAAHLSALVSQSMVQLEEISLERGRYRMLEPLRQYARARLADRGEAAKTAERHALHFLALIEQVEPLFYQAGSMPWIERIRAEMFARLGADQLQQATRRGAES